MSDITTTAPATTGFEGLELARPAVIGELARIEASTRAALALAAELRAAIASESEETISDGAHPRLETFWEQAGDVATDHDMCSEYDRMVEAVNGITREREWDVTMTVDVRVTVTTTVTASTYDRAVELGEGELGRAEIVEEINLNGWDDLEFIETSAD